MCMHTCLPLCVYIQIYVHTGLAVFLSTACTHMNAFSKYLLSANYILVIEVHNYCPKLFKSHVFKNPKVFKVYSLNEFIGMTLVNKIT